MGIPGNRARTEARHELPGAPGRAPETYFPLAGRRGCGCRNLLVVPRETSGTDAEAHRGGPEALSLAGAVGLLEPYRALQPLLEGLSARGSLSDVAIRALSSLAFHIAF